MNRNLSTTLNDKLNDIYNLCENKVKDLLSCFPNNEIALNEDEMFSVSFFNDDFNSHLVSVNRISLTHENKIKLFSRETSRLETAIYHNHEVSNYFVNNDEIIQIMGVIEERLNTMEKVIQKTKDF